MKKIKAAENKQVGQKSKNSNTLFVPSITEVEKFDNSPRMTKSDLIKHVNMVKSECPDSKFLGGYEDSIIGFDYNTKAIIYDGDQILNRMADNYIVGALEDGIEIDDRWEYYYNAVDYFEYNVLRFFDCHPVEDDRPLPIILRRFD